MLRGRDLIRLSERRIEQAEEQLDAAERRLQVGRATRSDVLRSQLERVPSCIRSVDTADTKDSRKHHNTDEVLAGPRGGYL